MSHRIVGVLRRIVLLLCAAALIIAAQPKVFAQSPISVELKSALERVEGMTAAELTRDSLGSVTVGIVSGADLIWAKSFGLANMEKKIPATIDSVYRIGSITKQFTGLMLLQLVDEQKVHLADPVEKYFPEINRVQGRMSWAPPITIIQLATMTSGLAKEPEDLSRYAKGPVSEWEQVLISALPNTRTMYEPGTRYLYSNVGYAILGALLGRVSGRPYVEYVKQRIFTPLQMTHTAFEPDNDNKANIAVGYEVGSDGKVDAQIPAREHEGRGYKVPNGAIYSTVSDLARFVEFELGQGPESVLKRMTLQENLTRTNSSSFDFRMGYGIGFMVNRRGELIYYGHDGSVAGYNASAIFERVSAMGVIVLRNVSGGKFSVPGLCVRILEEVARAKTARPAQQ